MSGYLRMLTHCIRAGVIALTPFSTRRPSLHYAIQGTPAVCMRAVGQVSSNSGRKGSSIN